MYSYIVTSQKPTAVTNSLVCNFLSTDESNLIISRGNHFEVYSLRDSNLELLHDFSLYGRIASMQVYRPSAGKQDLVLVLTERRQYCILGYDVATMTVVTRAGGNLKDRIGRDLDHGVRAIIDPDHKIAGLMLYEGVMKILLVDEPRVKESFNVRMEMVRYIDVQFLYGCVRPTIAVLYEENRRGRHIKTFIVDIRERELVAGPWAQNNVEMGAKMLIPIPSPTNGVIVVGESTVTYISGGGASGSVIQSVVINKSNICCVGRIDADGSRYLVGNTAGELFVLILIKEGSVVVNIAIDFIGVTSIPETLSYLSDGVVFVGSSLGNSQLIRLLSIAVGDSGQFLEVLEVHQNIGPIVDMCVVEAERQGQRQLVTCSGGFKDGSLRLVRCGVGIEEQASIAMPGIKGVWTLRQSDSSEYDKYLVQSFFGETRILVIEKEEMSEAEIPAFLNKEATLYCGNTNGSCIVQVTASSIILVDLQSGKLADCVAFGSQKATVASGNTEQVIVALSGGQVIYFELDSVSMKIVLVRSVELDQDVACISLRLTAATTNSGDTLSVDDIAVSMAIDGNGSPSVTTRASVAAGKSTLVVLGMWTDNSICVLALPTLIEVSRTPLGLDAQARDVLLVSLDSSDDSTQKGSASPTHLFVGLGDGTLLIYSLEINAGLPTLGSKRKISLGTTPLSFSIFLNASKQSQCVFVSCDRPTVVYMHAGKLLFSVVNINEVTGSVSFHSELFPYCLALSSKEGLMIGTIDDIQKIHIQSFFLEGDCPSRLCHHRQAGAFIVCSKKIVDGAVDENGPSRVLFLEEGTFERFHTFDLDVHESALCCSLCSFAGSHIEYVIVGTAYSIPEEREPSKGRLLVFELSSASEENSCDESMGTDRIADGRSVKLVAAKTTRGGVYSIAALCGKIAAGVGSKVHLFRFVSAHVNEMGLLEPASLQIECSHTGHILTLYMKADGESLLVGDILRSVTLLQYRPPEGDGANGTTAGQLVEVARDFSLNAMRAVEIVTQAPTATSNGEFYLGSDDYGNLFVTRRLADAPTEEERGKLLSVGAFNLGDFLNVICRGSLNSQPPASAAADAVMSGEAPFPSSSPREVSAASSSWSSSLLLGGISGAIYTLIPLDQETFTFFSCLETSLKVSPTCAGIGGLLHEDFRGFLNERRNFAQSNMIDGDLVERFLDLRGDELETVVRQLNDLLSLSATAAEGVPSRGKLSSSVSFPMNDEAAPPTSIKLFASPIYSSEECIRRVEDIARLH